MLDNLNQRIVLLETLDMEALPSSSYLLPAILARVSKATATGSDGDAATRGLLDDDPRIDRSFCDLQQYQSLVAKGIDGNLESRKGSLDSDAYAAEVRRHESARLALNYSLNRVLEVVSRGTRQHYPLHTEGAERRGDEMRRLFVLPIDDVDLNPTRSLELLRLVRTFSVPHLFLLVMGQLSTTQLVIEMNTLAEFSKLVRDKSELLKSQWDMALCVFQKSPRRTFANSSPPTSAFISRVSKNCQRTHSVPSTNSIG